MSKLFDCLHTSMLLLKKKQELLKDDIVTVSIRIRKLLNRNDDTLEQSG